MSDHQARAISSRLVSRRALAVGAAAAGGAIWLAPGTLPTRAAAPATAVYRGPTNKPIVALTFDGGSDRGHSVSVLDTLAANSIKATFPVTGHFAVANPDIIQRIVDEGHLLVNHSWSHPSFTGTSSSNVVLTAAARTRELEDCEAALVNAGGVGGKPWFRPPYGDFNASVLQHLGDNGFTTCLLWSLDVLGWNGLTRNQIISRVMANHGNGYIYLMHLGSDSQEGPALPDIISGLRNFGYGFASAADLLEGTAEPPPPLFDIGDTVRVTSALRLRTEPNLSGRTIVTMPAGTIGSVLGGPSPADGYTWYQIQTTYGTGWAATIGLVETTTQPPPPPPPPPTAEFKAGDKVRVTTSLRLRAGAGTGAGIIATMPAGTICTVLAGPSAASGYIWYQLDTPYGTGWAASAYLVKTTTTPPPPPPSGSWPVGTMVRTTANLRLRATPSTGGTIRATLPSGTVCKVVGGPLTGSGYTWYQLETSFGTGWAASAWLVRI